MKKYPQILTIYFFGFATLISAQCHVKVFAPDADHGDLFGASLSIDSLKTVVSAWRDDHSGEQDAGSVYIYDENNNYQTKIIVSNPNFQDFFGFDVDSYASPTMNRFIAGAHGDDSVASNAGAAYIFHWNGANWVEHKIVASDGSSTDFFGIRVSIYGDVATVSASLHDQNGTNTGAVYVFEYDGTSWNEVQKILASHSFDQDRFGFDVSLYQDRILAGSADHDHDPFTFPDDPGAVFVSEYDGTQWTATSEFTPTTISFGAGFGTSISQDDNRVLIGAPDEGAGICYLYDVDSTNNINNWVETEIAATGLNFSDEFGGVVAIQGDQFIVGSLDSDRADKFDWNGVQWIETNFTPPSGELGFGSAVDLYKGRTVIGSEFDKIGNDVVGSVLFYGQDIFFVDNDGDGFGQSENSIYSCSMPAIGYANNNLDCDDSNPNITYVGAPCALQNPCILNPVINSNCNCEGTIQSDLNIFNNFGGNDLWNDALNWSLGVVPDSCHDVIIPNGFTSIILPGESGICYKLTVEINASFSVDTSATFHSIVGQN